MLELLILVILLVFINVLSNLSISLNSELLFSVIVPSFSLVKMGWSVKSVCLISESSSFSVIMTILCVWVISLMMLVSLKYEFFGEGSWIFILNVLMLMLVVMLFFMASSFLVLYINFEFSLLPTLILILKWGYQPERLQASFYFLMYTICASLPLLVVLFKMKSIIHSMSMSSSFPMVVLGESVIGNIMYLGFVFAFLVKIPIWGVHLWLPKAHVEAPVSGSMILAGILLKLGGYGMLQIMNMLYKVNLNLGDFIFSMNIWSALMVSLVCMSMVDMKSLIAYSSVVHMGLMVVGIIKGSSISIFGGMLMMIAHGFSSPGMFVLASFNYEVIQSRNLLLHKGLNLIHPMMMFFWFLLIAANMAAPPSLNLVSEIMIYVGVVKTGMILGIILGVVTFLSAGYNLYLYSLQQSNKSMFILPSKMINSSMITVMMLHCFPVYLATFCISQLA